VANPAMQAKTVSARRPPCTRLEKSAPSMGRALASAVAEMLPTVSETMTR
jgi:hypothetical protein